jgi:hypothetical protein
MLLQYKTERLPLNFIMLGFTLIVVGIVTVVNGDYEGVAAFIFAIPLLFTHSGIIVDTDNRRIKKYTGLFNWQYGKWLDLKGARYMQIGRMNQNQGMWVASIPRTNKKQVHKLYVMLPHSRLELLTGTLEEIEARAKQIANGLNMDLKYPTSVKSVN